MALLTTLRAMVAGDSLEGLNGAAFQEAASRLPVEGKVALRRETWARLVELRAKLEAARLKDEAELAARIAEDQDRGLPFRPADDKRPHATDAAARISNMARGLGLTSPDGPVSARFVLEALAERVAALDELLQRDYAAKKEPAGLVEARRALSKATAATWTAQQAHVKAQQFYRHARDAEAERDAVAKHQAVVEAEARAHQLRQQLASEWGVKI